MSQPRRPAPSAHQHLYPQTPRGIVLCKHPRLGDHLACGLVLVTTPLSLRNDPVDLLQRNNRKAPLKKEGRAGLSIAVRPSPAETLGSCWGGDVETWSPRQLQLTGHGAQRRCPALDVVVARPFQVVPCLPHLFPLGWSPSSLWAWTGVWPLSWSSCLLLVGTVSKPGWSHGPWP